MGRDSCGDRRVGRVNRDGIGRSMGFGVINHHLWEFEILCKLGWHRGADEAAAGTQLIAITMKRGFPNLVCRIIKAIFSVVTASAAMIRSPSFSRSCESRTMINWPCSIESQGKHVIFNML